MASIEDVLAARIAQQNEQNDTLGQVLGATGAIGGAALGLAGGNLAHQATKAITGMINPKAIKTGLGLHSVRPGFRPAGLLVGGMLGGALGAGIAQAARQASPEADLLAKIQARGELNPEDINKLEGFLASSYREG